MMQKAVEIRSYNLKPGTRAEFHRQMTEQALPMLRRWNMDVVCCGPSPHDEDSYYLIRAYADVAARDAEQDAFYGSAAWRGGPREAIVSRIDSYTSVILMMAPDTVDALRR
jgi:hypothetical protein